MSAADITNLKASYRNYRPVKTPDFVNFGGFRGFRFLGPPDSKTVFTQVILECNILTFVVSYHSLPIVLIVSLETIRYDRRV